MSFLQRLAAPLLLRRVFAEVRGLRLAAERIADALEFDHPPRPAEVTEPIVRSQTDVSYVDARAMADMLHIEDQLAIVLGRAPSEAELERAFKTGGIL